MKSRYSLRTTDLNPIFGHPCDIRVLDFNKILILAQRLTENRYFYSRNCNISQSRVLQHLSYFEKMCIQISFYSHDSHLMILNSLVLGIVFEHVKLVVIGGLLVIEFGEKGSNIRANGRKRIYGTINNTGFEAN
jgi:hypothetical protein